MKKAEAKLLLPLVFACVAGAFGMVFTDFDSLYLVGTISAALFALLTPIGYFGGEYRTALRSVKKIKVLCMVTVILALGSVAAAVFRASYGSRENAIGDIGGVGSWSFAAVSLVICTFVVYVYAGDNYRRRSQQHS